MKAYVTVCMMLATGTLLRAADAPAPVKLTHDWPSWTGPDGLMAGKSTVPVLDDFSQARLVWVNEQDDLGYAKATSGGGHCYPKHMNPSGCGSLIVAGGLVIAGYFHPTDNVSSTNRAADTNAAARNVGKAPSKNAAGEGDPFATGGKDASVAGDGAAEDDAVKDVPPPPPKAGFAADDIVVAVDAATGKTRWKQVYKGKGLHRPVFKHPNYGPIPAAGDGPSSSLNATTPGQAKVFHLGSGALVYGLDLATGKPLWETGLGEYRAKLEEILARNAGKAPAECSAEIAKEWPWLMIAPLQVVEKTVFVTMGQWFQKEKHNPSKNEEEKAVRQVRMLFALDTDTGKILWNMRNAISEGTTVCAAEVGGKTYALAAGEDGYLRLLRPRTGEVVWQEYLGVQHRLQPIVAGGRAFVMGARAPQPGVFAPEACLAVYALSESGAKRLWQSEFVFRQVCLWTPLAYRNNVIYAGLVPTRATPEGEVLAFRAEDGQILGRISGSYLFHLWGDRLVRPGDVNHESMGAACTYTAVSGDLTDLALSGTPFAFRNQGPYKGVCGYEVLMHHPFVDGYLFTRAVDCVKGKGVILCWDVRATGEPAKPAPGKQAEPKGMTKGRSNAVPMRQEGAPAKKDTPPPDVGTADLLEL